MVDKLRVVHPTSDITTAVALRRVDDAFFIHHCGAGPPMFCGCELTAPMLLLIPVPLLQRLTFGRRPDGRPRQK